VTLLRDALRLFSTAATVLVAVSFALFVYDEASIASQRQRAALGVEGPPSASATAEGRRETRHGAVRELIEDANDALLRPFASLTSTDSAWSRRMTCGLAALLAYGLGLRLLAGYLSPRRAR
jgi:hypothetical protein